MPLDDKTWSPSTEVEAPGIGLIAEHAIGDAKVSIAAENGSMEKFGTRKKTRERFLVNGLFIERFPAPRMSHLSRGLASSGNSKNDIGMDASDCKEINVCDIEPAGVKIGKRL